MKKYILINMILISRFLGYTADLPPKTIEYIREEENQVCTPKYKEECKKKEYQICDKVYYDDDGQGHSNCYTEIKNECSQVEYGVDCVSATEYIKEYIATGKYDISEIEDKIPQLARMSIREKHNKLNSQKEEYKATYLTRRQVYEMKKRNMTEDEYKQYLIEYESKVLTEVLKDYSTNSGDNITLDKHKNKVNSKANEVSKPVEITDEMINKRLNEFAQSRQMYEYHNLLHKSGYDLEYVYNPNDFNPMAIPIILDENSSPTDKDLMEGRPIYKKRAEIVFDNSTESDDENQNIVTITYDKNGADYGIVPYTQNVLKNRYFSISDNIGNLVKKGYKFDGWSQSSDGSSAIYKPNKTIIAYENMTLYAIWKKVEVVENKKAASETKNKYIIEFIANEYSKLNGDSILEINKGDKIQKIPEVIVDRGYELVGFKDNVGKVYSSDEIKEFIPKGNMTLLIITKQIEYEMIDAMKLVSAKRKITKEGLKEEKRPDIKYLSIEKYVSDKISPEEIIENIDDLSMYSIHFDIVPNLDKKGITNASVFLINLVTNKLHDKYDSVDITVLDKPVLKYKNTRTKEIGKTVNIYDLIDNNLDKRYEVYIENEIDNTKIGTKDVKLYVLDKYLNRKFSGYSTDITFVESLDILNWKKDPQVYINDKVNINHLLDNIPSKYTITIEDNVDTSSSGSKKVVLNIENKTSGSRWKVEKNILVLKEPELIGNGLTIYQNHKNPNKVGVEFENDIKIDLNEIYESRYTLKYKNHLDISKLGTTQFVYTITDTELNRHFDKKIDVNVIEENLDIVFKKGLKFNVGYKVKVSDLIENENSNYDIKIENTEQLNKLRLNIGVATVKLEIKSKISNKIWNISVDIEYIENIINLGELVWEKGNKLTLEDIRKLKEIPENIKMILIKPDKLRYSDIEKYNATIKLIDDDGVYTIANLIINIVENTMINDLIKINRNNKVHIITGISKISQRLSDTLVTKYNKKNNFWIMPSTSIYKYKVGINGKVIGANIGYDRSFDNDLVVGSYIGFDNLKYNLSSKSNQNLYSIGLYIGKKYDISDIYKIYMGTVVQYTKTLGLLKFKNINNENIAVNENSNNIALNVFYGLNQKNENNTYLSLHLGNTLLFNFNNKIRNNNLKVDLLNNLTNEIYLSYKLNKQINKANYYLNAKAGWLYGRNKYILNGVKFDDTVNIPNVYGIVGFDYNYSENTKIGLSTFIKNKDTIYNFYSGVKLNMEYKW